MAELQLLGLGPWVDEHIQHAGLRMAGFGSTVQVDWPGPAFPSTGSAVPRTELDDRIRQVAEASGATMKLGAKVVDVEHDSSGRVVAVVLADGSRVGCRALIVADGARSTLGRVLGRQWHQETVYGVAARGLSDVAAGRRAVDLLGSGTAVGVAATCCPGTAGSSRSATAR